MFVSILYEWCTAFSFNYRESENQRMHKRELQRIKECIKEIMPIYWYIHIVGELYGKEQGKYKHYNKKLGLIDLDYNPKHDFLGASPVTKMGFAFKYACLWLFCYNSTHICSMGLTPRKVILGWHWWWKVPSKYHVM